MDSKSSFNFVGHLPYVEAAADQFQLPRRLVAKIAAAPPITIASRVLAGLSEISRRAKGRPFFDVEMASIRSALDDVVEVVWHYRAAAGTANGMVGDGWLALHSSESGGFGEAESGDAGETAQPPATFAGVGPYLAAERDRLGLHELIADRVRNIPELGSIGRRIGHVCDGLRRGTMSAEIVRSELDCAAHDVLVLAVLANAAESMLDDAYRGFGLDMPDTPPVGRPESRCCATSVYRQRSRAQSAAFFA